MEALPAFDLGDLCVLCGGKRLKAKIEIQTPYSSGTSEQAGNSGCQQPQILQAAQISEKSRGGRSFLCFGIGS
jgi:hypothetical protein